MIHPFLKLIPACLILFNSCGDAQQQQGKEDARYETTQDINTNDQAAVNNLSIRVDTIATGLENPWGMVFLPDNRVLITERKGSVKIIKDGRLSSDEIKNVPRVYARGQGGLLDIQLHPEFNTNGWIYFAYSKPGNGGAATAVSRARLNNNSFVNIEEVFVAEPFISSGLHFGCRIVFDENNYMYISIGERGNKSNAQDLSNHYGKVLRLHDDGRIPDDNPFVDRNNAKPAIWCYGNRNIQGMYYERKNKILWSHEHGPRGGDEINIIEKGANYGWPVVTYGVDYDGSIISREKEKEGIQSPVHVWTPSIAPCGMTMVTSNKYPGWEGNILSGALILQHVSRVVIENKKVVHEERLLEGMARFRDVKQAPDGYIYALTENPGMFLRIIPVD